MYYIFNFITYSIIGFIIEIIFKGILNFNLHSGILYGPYSPVYGFAITLIYFLYEKVEKKYNLKEKKYKKFFIFLIIPFFLISILEALGGYLIEFCFDKVFWNYDDMFLNIGHYVSIEMSFIWSIGIILFYKFVKPKTDHLYFITHINIIRIVALIMIVDVILTIINKINA